MHIDTSAHRPPVDFLGGDEHRAEFILVPGEPFLESDQIKLSGAYLGVLLGEVYGWE